MTSLHGDFETDLPAPEALTACAEALDGLGWRVEDVEVDRIVSFADGQQGRGGARIEVVLSGSERATDVRIQGSDSETQPLPTEHLVAYLNQASAAIQQAVERASAPRGGSLLDRIELFDERHPALQVFGALILPLLFGALVGVVLGISAGPYWLLQLVAFVGGIGAGLEHRTPRQGALRGVVGGGLFGAGLLIAHAIADNGTEVKLPDPPVILVAFTILGGVIGGLIGGRLRRRSLGG
jgi:hypothetical protein